MRHRKTGNRLGRTTSHRKALLSNLAISLIEHKRIKTTLAKAKEARKTIDRLITFAKKGTIAARREVLKIVRDKVIVKALFDEIAPNYSERNGGYTRIIKLGRRVGDGASLAYLELVGFEGIHVEKKKEKAAAKEKKKAKEKEKEKATATEE